MGIGENTMETTTFDVEGYIEIKQPEDDDLMKQAKELLPGIYRDDNLLGIIGNEEGEPVRVVKVNGKVLDLERSLKVADHSPDGFSWGYWGSGPAQAAFAILQHVFGDDFAKENTQRFKFDVIGNQEIDKPFNIKVAVTRNGDQGEFSFVKKVE
jgi:hypothetical protein